MKRMQTLLNSINFLQHQSMHGQLNFKRQHSAQATLCGSVCVLVPARLGIAGAALAFSSGFQPTGPLSINHFQLCCWGEK